MTESAQNSWDRQPNERNLWFDRFTRFRLMGADRSISAIYNEWRVSRGRERSPNVAGSWRRAAKEWNWVERAQDWDAAERERLNAEHAALRQQIREDRQRVLRAYLAKIASALNALEGDRISDMSVSDLTAAIRLVVSELRTEFDDQPAERILLGEFDVEEWKARQEARLAEIDELEDYSQDENAEGDS